MRGQYILGIRKTVTFLKVINKPTIYKFFKGFTNHKKNTNRTVVFSCTTLSKILKHRDQRSCLPTIQKTRSLQVYIDHLHHLHHLSLPIHHSSVPNFLTYNWITFCCFVCTTLKFLIILFTGYQIFYIKQSFSITCSFLGGMQKCSVSCITVFPCYQLDCLHLWTFLWLLDVSLKGLYMQF